MGVEGAFQPAPVHDLADFIKISLWHGIDMIRRLAQIYQRRTEGIVYFNRSLI